MDIESPSITPYYLPNNKSASQSGKMFQSGMNRGPTQGNSLSAMSMNQSQNVSGNNYSNLSMGNNLSLSQMGNPNTYGLPNRINAQQQQQNPYYNNYNGYNNQNNNYMQKNNNYPNNNTYQNSNNYPNNQNFPNNYNYQNYNNPNYQHNRINQTPPPQQQYQLP